MSLISFFLSSLCITRLLTPRCLKGPEASSRNVLRRFPGENSM
ncbi:BgtTE-56032 [Blumeria graminis f. sp. tritici]|uniref:BgtTE-56032 n=1 Tax=Blumeria graminis f. sp. tritici TaxID=62690 RepID=A0A9X9LBD7_BLUGR|nr:BgtTE-56032 [Blumeria graminis f. sp. tritici]